MATDSNRVRSGPRLVTSVNRNQIDTGAQFSVILGTGEQIMIEILLKKVRHEKCDPLFWKEVWWSHNLGMTFYYDSKNIL